MQQDDNLKGADKSKTWTSLQRGNQQNCKLNQFEKSDDINYCWRAPAMSIVCGDSCGHSASTELLNFILDLMILIPPPHVGSKCPGNNKKPKNLTSWLHRSTSPRCLCNSPIPLAWTTSWSRPWQSPGHRFHGWCSCIWRPQMKSVFGKPNNAPTLSKQKF